MEPLKLWQNDAYVVLESLCDGGVDPVKDAPGVMWDRLRFLDTEPLRNFYDVLSEEDPNHRIVVMNANVRAGPPTPARAGV